jgi:general secretion pathway protein B
VSYILDALKKADADRERQRNAVPGLLAQSDDDERGPRRRSVAWAALAMGALVVGVVLWGWLRPRGGAEAPAPIATTSTAPATMASPAAPSPTGVVPAPTAAAPDLTAPAPQRPPAPATAPVRVATATTTVPAPGPPMPAAARAPTPKAVNPAPSPAAEARLPTREQLPADVRAALPPLQVSGAVNAPQPNARMLFLNGMVLREGEAAGVDLTVERIGAASSVLVFRGQRFELKH